MFITSAINNPAVLSSNNYSMQEREKNARIFTKMRSSWCSRFSSKGYGNFVANAPSSKNSYQYLRNSGRIVFVLLFLEHRVWEIRDPVCNVHLKTLHHGQLYIACHVIESKKCAGVNQWNKRKEYIFYMIVMLVRSKSKDDNDSLYIKKTMMMIRT